MKVKIGAIESRDGRSSLTFELADGEYTAHGRLDLTALYYLMTNASTTKTGRAKRGPVTLTRARRSVTLREAIESTVDLVLRDREPSAPDLDTLPL